MGQVESPRRANRVRAALRSATDATHQRMHGLAPFQAIADGTLTAELYPPLLQSLLMFHSTVGSAAMRHGWSVMSSAPARTELLRNDLRCLGGGARPAAVTLQARSPNEALGALYAAEGSMLGGRIIARQLDYLFGSAEDGRRFFIGSPGDGASWSRLLAGLEVHCTHPAALAEAIGGALLAFDLFARCVMGPSADDRLVCSGAFVTRVFERNRAARA